MRREKKDLFYFARSAYVYKIKMLNIYNLSEFVRIKEQEKEYKREIVWYISKRYGSLNFIHMLMQQDEQMAIPITYTCPHQNGI